MPSGGSGLRGWRRSRFFRWREDVTGVNPVTSVVSALRRRLAGLTAFSTKPNLLRKIGLVSGLQAYQPHCFPAFCCCNHACNGAKYSSIGLPDISRLPVKACSASGHGLDAPICSMAFSRWPTSLFP